MLPRRKESSRYREIQSFPTCVDARDDVDDAMRVHSVPHQRQGDHNALAFTSDTTIQEFQIKKTPTEIMRDNLANCQKRQTSLNATQETGPSDLPHCGAVNSSHVGTVPAVFQDQVPIFSFKAHYPLHAHKPGVRQLHHKIVSVFSKSHYDPRKKQSPGPKDYEPEKSIGKHFRSRSFACHGTIQKSHPLDTVPASTLSVDKGIQSTYLRRRLTPEFTSISDLQARFHSKSHLHQELDQLVNARSVASTYSIPGATLRDPHGATVSPFVEADDEDSEIQSDVSSAIEITDSAARTQKLFHYLRSANKLSQLNPLTDQQVRKTDSCPFADFESQHSIGKTRILVDGVLTMENVGKSDETGMNKGDRQASLSKMAPSSTVCDGSEEHEKDSIVFCDSSDRHDRLSEGIETPDERPNPSSTRVGELDESRTKGVNHFATSIMVDGLVNPVTSVVANGNMELLAARSNEEEENEGWVSFGGFNEPPKANVIAPDERNKPAHQSRIKEKAKAPLLSIETGSKVIIDLSGTNSNFHELIVHMNSGDVSELTDFDFPDVSKASHPVDQDTQQRLTTSDIIRLSRNRLIEKKRLKHGNQEQPHLQEEGCVVPPKAKVAVPKADFPPGLFNRPSSTPFQNKAQDGSISGMTIAPRSVLRRSSFCGSNQSDALPYAVRGTTDSTRESQVAIDNTLSAPPSSKGKKGKKDTPMVMADASSMNPVGPTGVSSDEEDDDDPLSRLQCLTRIAI